MHGHAPSSCNFVVCLSGPSHGLATIFATKTTTVFSATDVDSPETLDGAWHAGQLQCVWRSPVPHCSRCPYINLSAHVETPVPSRV